MNAEVLCVGTELLLGDTVNTNAAYIGRGLSSLGINLYYHTVVGDNPERLKKCLETAFSRSQLVIMTGGLGPTYDDLTKETVGEYFGLEMITDERQKEILEKRFIRNNGKMPESNYKQAMFPKGAVPLDNEFGTAPGMALEKDGKIVILMPGPPAEMMPMFENEVRPFLAKYSDHILVSRTVHLIGLGESAAEEILHDIMVSSTNPTLAPYAKMGEVKLRVTASAADETEALKLINPIINVIEERVGKYIYGYDSEGINDAAVSLLKEKGLTIAAAESCTGGLISKMITDIPGASGVFSCGVCAYSNDIKESVLGVSPQTIERLGAVSAETAEEMARGIRKLSGADIGISTTGIAGPDGGTLEKPVGTVWGAISDKNGEESFLLPTAWAARRGRQAIRDTAALQMFSMLIKRLKGL